MLSQHSVNHRIAKASCVLQSLQPVQAVLSNLQTHAACYIMGPSCLSRFALFMALSRTWHDTTTSVRSSLWSTSVPGEGRSV